LVEDRARIEEKIVTANALAAHASSPPGAGLYIFVSEECGASSFSTGLARFAAASSLPYHTHPFSEAVTIVEGRARFVVEGRAYRLHAGDSIHIPEGIAHMVRNDRPARELIAHWAFAGAKPDRKLTDHIFPGEERGDGNPSDADPETIVRYDTSAVYELAKNAHFLDLFARRFGAKGICGGHGRFLPGASLPCHIHDFDESITIVSGTALCLVQGRRYELSDFDTAFIPRGIPHRFLNESGGEMAMIWVYAGDEPDRKVVNAGYCSGELSWPGAPLAQEESQ
jgi:quercetin dioxygenase-like cupin family protein